jgi:hypothetical protein
MPFNIPKLVYIKTKYVMKYTSILLQEAFKNIPKCTQIGTQIRTPSGNPVPNVVYSDLEREDADL